MTVKREGKCYGEAEEFYQQPQALVGLLARGNYVQLERDGRPLAIIHPAAKGDRDFTGGRSVKLVTVNRLKEMEREMLLGRTALILNHGQPVGVAVSVLASEEVAANLEAESRRIKDYMDKNYPRRVNVVGRLEMSDISARWEYIRDVISGDGDLLVTRASEPAAYICPTPQARLTEESRFGRVEVGSLSGRHEILVGELQRYEYVLLVKDKPNAGSSVWDLGAATAAIPPEALR